MGQKDLHVILEKYSPAEEIEQVVANLFKNNISLDIKKIFVDNKKIENINLVKLNILIQNEELSSVELNWLAGRNFIQGLSARSLLTIAKSIEKKDPSKALQLMQWSARRINNTTVLLQGLSIMNSLDFKKLKNKKLNKTKIAVAGNCTLKPLADYLKLAMLSYNIMGEIKELPFDQWIGQCLDGNSELYKFNPSFLVLYLSSLGLTEAGTKTQFETLEFLKKSINAILSKSSLKIIMILPEPLEEEYFTSSDLYHWRQEYIEQLRKNYSDKVIFIDPTITITEVGRAKWFAAKFWYHGKFPCHPNSLLTLGKHVSTSIAHCISLPIKVIVCDLDNTLWGGIVGEDGYQNLKLDVHGLGGPYVRLQRFLKSLIKKGIVLVAVSKNNEDDVREVFAKRPEMLLEWEDFAVVMANWAPKSENIIKIAKTLNLGLDYFCFIDDSPFEREEVSEALPEVMVLDLPTNPEEMVSLIINSEIFHVPLSTEEDQARNEYYKNEITRAEAQQSSGADLQAFLTSLSLKLLLTRINSENIDRVVQLINKTNQFNLRTARYDFEQVKGITKSKNNYAYCCRVVDKFGDSGIVGVMLVLPTEKPKEYFIDTWLLSCRVMGRTVERAMFEHLLNWLKNIKAEKIIGEYLPTKKNLPVKGLYPELGFKPGTKTGQYIFAVNASYFDNKYVELIQE